MVDLKEKKMKKLLYYWNTSNAYSFQIRKEEASKIIFWKKVWMLPKFYTTFQLLKKIYVMDIWC